MKKLSFLVLVTISCLKIHAQCSGLAGEDLYFCDQNDFFSQDFQLGSSDSTIDISNFTFSWSLLNPNPNFPIYPSLYLSDTTILNPELINFHSNLSFVLSSTDSLNQICMDTVTVSSAQYAICLADCISYISQGDSTSIFTCNYPISEPPLTVLVTEGIDTIYGPSVYYDYEVNLPYVSPTESTNYYITTKNNNGCLTSFTCTIYVTLTNVTEAELSEIIVTKNPFNDQLSFSANSIKNYNLNYQIVSSVGKILKIGNLKKYNNINTSHFSNGIYFLKINDEGKTLRTFKLLKTFNY